jgi:hypothetical protein
MCCDPPPRVARLVAVTHPVSQALSTVLRLSMIETRNQFDMFSRERRRECAAPAPITNLKPFMQSKVSMTKVSCSIGQKPIPWLH